MKDADIDSGGGSVGSTSSSLLERAVNHAPDAWERLVTLYGPMVYGWARQTGLQPDDAADITQEVFGSLVTSLSRFRSDGDNPTFRGWLWTVTRNKVRDALRKQDGRPHAVGGTDAQERMLQVPDMVADGSSEITRGPANSLLTQVLERIRPDFEQATWQAFWNVVVLGGQPTDVAARLGISVNAVYIARSRVLRRLRDSLNPETHQPEA
jgi:RNA polymerase sigma-70 factor, ECF subfamily